MKGSSEMEIYEVNRKHYFKNLDKAIEKGKEIIRNYYYKSEMCRENWKITKGKNGGYCVQSIDDWEKVGNIHYLKVSIRAITVE